MCVCGCGCVCVVCGCVWVCVVCVWVCVCGVCVWVGVLCDDGREGESLRCFSGSIVRVKYFSDEGE